SGLFRMRMANTAFGTCSNVSLISARSTFMTASYSPRICVLMALVSTSTESWALKRRITSLIGVRNSSVSGYRLMSTATRMSGAPSEPHLESGAHLARIAAADVELVREIRRLVAEEEPAHGVGLVQQVAGPQGRGPALGFVPDAGVDELVRLGALVVADVEIERVARGDVEAGEKA